MKLTRNESVCGAIGRLGCRIGLAMLAMMVPGVGAQGVSTTTVQGTVYLANGQPGAGTLSLSWPSFTTAAGQAIAADRMTINIPADGFISVKLAPNQGATPAGEYYTAVFYMSDGSSNTEYWLVPAGAQATIGQVRAQVMPAAQAAQAASKTYVDQSISQLSASLLTASGGTLSGPLYLNGDPTQPLQAADKHYVDAQVATAVPLSGGQMTGPLTLSGDPTQDQQAAEKHYVDAAAANAWPSAVLRTDEYAGADFGAKLQACLNAVNSTYGGTCDARNFTGNQSISANLTISIANTSVLLPCATISTASQIVVSAGTRNVALRGCALRGGSAADGSQGGTALAYSGAAAFIQVGDPAYATDTPGFHLDNVVINTTAAGSASAQGLVAYRTQEMDVESVYFLGSANQTGMTLDGTGNYTGGTFFDDQFSGFQTAVNAIGHQAANPATTDWMNASSFVRLHINCPTSSGNPIAGTYGINLQQGDGNTFTGGDVEGCETALHLGPNAQNNTIVGLRNENSTSQVVADAGSSYNNWITGGTMFTGKLTDNGTRNSFLDSFHRSFNGLNGDWYGSQQDATVTNHFRLGTGAGNERGLLNRYQTDYGYRWTTGLSDAIGGEQFYQVQDELNNVYRLSIGQYNSGQSSTNNQTVINAAGTGAVVLNGSNNSGTGGVVIGSGGPSETTVATISNTGNAQFNGTLLVGGTSQFTGTPTVRNGANAEVDYYLWPGLTTSQKGSFTYKDWNGSSQWYMLKDASNNWALNSAIGGLDSFKAYQSSNSGDTYINASNASGVVRVNYETGSGSAFKVYGGGSGTLYASFTGAGAIAFPGLAAGTGHSCLQIDTSGYVTNTGSACGTGSGGGSTVSSSTPGYIAYYTGNGTSIGGTSAVPLAAGGTGATTAAGALASLGGFPLAGGTLTGALNGTSGGFSGTLAAGSACPGGAVAGSICSPVDPLNAAWYGVSKDNPDNKNAINACLKAAYDMGGGTCRLPSGGNYKVSGPIILKQQTRLVGQTNTLQGVFGQNTGAAIVYTGTGGCLIQDDPTDSNPGYASEVAWLAFYGSASGDTAVCLNGKLNDPPQFTKVHDNTFRNFTNWIQMTQFSYIKIYDNYADGIHTTGSIGLDLEPYTGGGSPINELTYVTHNAILDYDKGMRFAAGNQLFVDENDVAQNAAVGMEFERISGINLTRNNIIDSHNDILFDPSGSDVVAGVHFRDQSIFMRGTDATDVAINEIGTNSVMNLSFEGSSGIAVLGATQPTTSINLPNIRNDITNGLVFDGFSDGTTGNHVIAGAPTTNITAFNKRMSGWDLWDGLANSPNLSSSAGSGGYLDGYEIWGSEHISGSNYHVQGIQWTASACPGGLPGIGFYGDDLSGAGVARNYPMVPMAGCLTNPNPAANANGNKYGNWYAGGYIANPADNQTAFESHPSTSSTPQADAWRGYYPGTSTVDYEVTNAGDGQFHSLQIGSSSNTVVPPQATGYSGTSSGKVELVETAATGTIGGSALAAGDCASGTATISASATGHPVSVAESDGSFIGGAFTVRGTVSGSTVTVHVCAVIAGTPPAETYNVTVF